MSGCLPCGHFFAKPFAPLPFVSQVEVRARPMWRLAEDHSTSWGGTAMTPYEKRLSDRNGRNTQFPCLSNARFSATQCGKYWKLSMRVRQMLVEPSGWKTQLMESPEKCSNAYLPDRVFNRKS